jgi:hypothetical protein
VADLHEIMGGWRMGQRIPRCGVMVLWSSECLWFWVSTIRFLLLFFSSSFFLLLFLSRSNIRSSTISTMNYPTGPIFYQLLQSCDLH